MLPYELEKLANSDENDIGLNITNVEYSTLNPIISFSLKINGYDETPSTLEHWTVEAIACRKKFICFDYTSNIKIETEHPLLWEFTGIQCSLYYTGWCNDAPKLFFDLYMAHKQIFGNTQCFNVHFNIEKTYPRLSAYSNGLLTSGPKRLMEVYAQCLRNNGLDYTLIGERPAKYWDGEQYIVEEEGLKVLFIGDTFVIAKDFVFKQQTDVIPVNHHD